MGKSRGLVAAANKLKAAGRNGDTEIAHLSPNEIAILDYWQGGPSINPETGQREYFKLKSILKSVAKAAGALAGAYFGGPAGAAVGGGLTSALLGDSMQKSLTTGLLSGLGAYGAQQTGLGDTLGIKGLSEGTNLLGQTAAAGAASKGGGMGMSALLPLLGLGAAAAASGGPKAPKSANSSAAEDNSKAVEYEPLDREQLASAGDPYSYGQFGPEFQYFDEVNPALQPLSHGGRVHYATGGRASDEPPHAGSGGGQTAGMGGNTGGRNSSGAGSDRSTTGSFTDMGNRSVQTSSRTSAAPPHAGTGGGQTAGLGNTGGARTGSVGAGERGTLSQQQDVRNLATARAYGNTAPGVGNYSDAMDDYNDVGNSTLENIGNALAAFFGIKEISPATQPAGTFKTKNTAEWGVDPVGAAIGLGGLTGALPWGVGAMYNLGLNALGTQGPMVSFSGTPVDWSVNPHGEVNEDGSYATGLGSLFGDTARNLGLDIGSGQGSGLGGLHPEPGAGSDRMTARAQAGTPNAVQTSNGTSTTSTGGGAGTTPTPDGTSEITDRTYNPLTDAYTYGQFGPEHLFYVNGPLFPPGTTAALRPDRSHTIEQPIDKSRPLIRGDLNMRDGGGVNGPGTGQSDDIPAMLSDGEHVIDAETVSMLGDGSNTAGHQKIEQFKRNIRAHKRKAKPTKIPPKAKGIGQYMTQRRAA